TSHSQIKGNQRRVQNQDLLVQSVPGGSHSVVNPTCNICGKMHSGQCWFKPRVCYRCKQPGHIAWECPYKGTQQSVALDSQPTVQNEQFIGRGSIGRGKFQGQASNQNIGQPQTQAYVPAGRGQGRVFALNQEETPILNVDEGMFFKNFLSDDLN